MQIRTKTNTNATSNYRGLSYAALITTVSTWACSGAYDDFDSRGGAELGTEEAVAAQREALVVGGDERLNLYPLTFPWVSTVRLDLAIPNDGRRTHCSGSLVGPDKVVTAAHCLYLNGVFVSDLIVTPAQNGLWKPFGRTTLSDISYLSEYPKHPATETSRYDIAAIWTVDAIGDSAPIAPTCKLSHDTPYFVGVSGYPEVGPDGARNSDYLWAARDAVIHSDSEIVAHEVDTTGGQSGGPIFYGKTGGCVGAVHSASIPDTGLLFTRSDWNAGVRIEPLLPVLRQPSKGVPIMWGADVSKWVDLGGQTWERPAVATWKGQDEVHVVYREPPNGAVFHGVINARSPGAPSWTKIRDASKWSPAAVKRSQSVLDVIAVDWDGSVWNRRLTGQSWSTESVAPAGTLDGPPTVIAPNPLGLHVFGRRADGRLVQITYSVFTGWKAPVVLPASVNLGLKDLRQRVAALAVEGTDANNGLRLFYHDDDGATLTTYDPGSGKWRPPASLSEHDADESEQVLSSLEAVSLGGNKVQLVARVATNGKVIVRDLPICDGVLCRADNPRTISDDESDALVPELAVVSRKDGEVNYFIGYEQSLGKGNGRVKTKRGSASATALWDDLAGSVLDLAAAATDSDHIAVVARGRDNRLRLHVMDFGILTGGPRIPRGPIFHKNF